LVNLQNSNLSPFEQWLEGKSAPAYSDPCTEAAVSYGIEPVDGTWRLWAAHGCTTKSVKVELVVPKRNCVYGDIPHNAWYNPPTGDATFVECRKRKPTRQNDRITYTIAPAASSND